MDNHGAGNSIFTASFSRTGGDNVSRRRFKAQQGAMGQKTEVKNVFTTGLAYDWTVKTVVVVTAGSYADPTAVIIYLLLIRFSVICRDSELIRT